MIHRDIKPANLLLDKKGTVKILDMGLARLQATNGPDRYDPTQAELTQDGSVFGTVDYMSPEQALNSKDADARADIYSLGCSLHYLLTGQAVYHGESLMAKMLAHRESEIPVLHEKRDGVPERLSEIFARMVAKKVEDRYPTMSALLADLEALAEDVVEDDEVEGAAADATVVVASSVDLQSKETSSASMGDTVDYTGRVAPKPAKPKPLPEGIPRRAWLAVSGGVVAVGLAILGYLYFAGVIFKIETADGVIQIETNVTDVEIYVDNEKVVYITDPKDKTKIQVAIPKGSKTLLVSKGGFEADVKEFKLNTVKGPIQVTFVPLTKEPTGGDPHRQVVKWALDLGGRIAISESTASGHLVSSLDELPAGTFRITTIDLFDNERVSDTSLQELHRLCPDLHVDYCYLEGTSITDTGLAHLAGFHIQKVLVLNQTNTSDDGLIYLGKLKHLGSLSLGQTKITDDGVKQIAQMSSRLGLTRLDVSGISLTDQGLKYIGEIQDLQTLSLMTNPKITSQGLNHLTSLHQLHTLQLVNSIRISDTDCEMLGQFPLLHRLEFNGDPTQLTDKGLEHLGSLVNLTTLSVTNSAIRGSGFVHLQNLPLSRLEIFHSQIEDDNLKYLVGHKTLRQLRIYGNPISDAGLAYIKQIPSLENLNLNGTQITDRGLPQLYELRNLKSLILLNNDGITPAGINALQKALPNCKIEHESITADPNRRFAEKVLELGGIVVTYQGSEVVRDANQLPDEFRFQTIDFSNNPKVTDDQLASLHDLQPLLNAYDVGLQGTPITNSGIAHLSGFSVNTLTLSYTAISDDGVAHLARLGEVSNLSLDRTKVTDVGLEAIASSELLIGMQGLGLRGTTITDAGLRHVGRLSKLKTLSIGGTKITDEGLSHIASLRELKFLYLDGTFDFTGRGLKHLQGLSNLEHLDLSSTAVTDKELVHLAALTGLRRLRLVAERNLTGSGFPHLKQINLEELLLGGCGIVGDKGIAQLAGHPTLRVLDLNGTQVSDIGLKHLASIPTLESLELRDTPISDEGLRHLYGLEQMQTVDLRNNGERLTAKGVAALQKALPDCVIEHDPFPANDTNPDETPE